MTVINNYVTTFDGWEFPDNVRRQDSHDNVFNYAPCRRTKSLTAKEILNNQNFHSTPNNVPLRILASPGTCLQVSKTPWANRPILVCTGTGAAVVTRGARGASVSAPFISISITFHLHWRMNLGWQRRIRYETNPRQSYDSISCTSGLCKAS